MKYLVNIRFLSYFLFVFFIFSAQSCNPSAARLPIQSSKKSIASKAMVVSAHPLATKIGLEVMKQGGNAVDAAVAVQFALAVVYPGAGNIGGGGFMIIRTKDGSTDALDFREMAPAAAHRNMYLDADGNVIKGLSLDGHRAAGVPGSVAGMFAAHERYGKNKDISALIAPAFRLAQKGFSISQQEATRLNKFQDAFTKLNTTTPVFVNKKGWKSNDLLRQKELAQTLQAIMDRGTAGFYEGPVADKIVAEMAAGKGIITHQDLKNYEAKWRKPISMPYKDYEVISMPPPSSGGIALAQLLEIASHYPIKSWGFQSVNSSHLIAEAERRVYADRAEHLGDSDFYPVPQKNLLDPAYLRKRMKSYKPSAVSSSEELSAGSFAPPESEETTHFSIVDAEGNAVSITTTLNASYGSKTVVTGAGFLLNNEMDDFSSKPGTPNFYGLIGAEANAIEAGKRMLSSMTPTIVTKDKNLFMVLGTPGGSTIITSVFQTILNVVEYDMGMAEAVAKPRFHHQWLPDQIYYEEGALGEVTIKGLEKLGHQTKLRESIGRVDAILVRADGTLEGGADPRGDDHAEGF